MWGKCMQEHHPPPDDQVHHLPRYQLTTIFHPYTGHCHLRSHLYCLGQSHTPDCHPCKTAQQIHQHILQPYSRYKKARNQFRAQEATLQEKLWGSQEQLEKTVYFILFTNIQVWSLFSLEHWRCVGSMGFKFHPSHTSHLAKWYSTGSSPDFMGLVQGLVGRVSVHYNWVKPQVESATSIWVWRTWNCLSRSVPETGFASCCLHMQPTNRETRSYKSIHQPGIDWLMRQTPQQPSTDFPVFLASSRLCWHHQKCHCRCLAVCRW